MSEFMQMGGVFMWPVMIFGLATLAVALRYALTPEPARLRQTFALGLVTLLSGLSGTALGFIVTLTAMGEVAPDKRFIAMIGLGESLCNVALALVLVTFAALIGAFGTWRTPKSAPAQATSVSLSM